MGQSSLSAANKRRRSPVFCTQTAATTLSVFFTELGWFGLVGTGNIVHGLTIGHRDAAEVRSALARSAAQPDHGEAEGDWHPPLRRDLQAYARGECIGFGSYRIALPRLTDFQNRVIQAARRIPYGRTMTYRQLAERVACDRGARAVGNVMASNRVPILVPCHRVVASGGIGGFSAPQGVTLKDCMLRLERRESL